MTNGGILFFKNRYDLNKNLDKLSKYNLYGYNLFETKILSSKKKFFRIQVKSFSPLNDKSSKIIS